MPKSVGSAEKYECRRKVSDRQRSAGSIGVPVPVALRLWEPVKVEADVDDRHVAIVEVRPPLGRARCAHPCLADLRELLNAADPNRSADQGDLVRDQAWSELPIPHGRAQ